jgi:hypothetical protein
LRPASFRPKARASASTPAPRRASAPSAATRWAGSAIEELQNLATFLLADGCEWLTGQTITLDGSQSHATGSNFYELRHWTDAQWLAAREAIKAQNEKDRAQRAV